MKAFQRHKGNFAVALQKVRAASQSLATPAQAIDERMKQGVKADISKNGAWYAASFNEVNGTILATLLNYNPLVAYSEQATESHRKGEFYLTDEVLLNGEPATAVLERIAEQDARKSIGRKRVIDLGNQVTHDVSTDSLADDDTIAFVAQGKQRADKYGRWLRNKVGIKSLKVYMQNLTGKNKSRGFWLGGFGGGGNSDFNCNAGGLYYGSCSLFGVYESAEGTSRKKSGPESKIVRPSLYDVLRFSRPFIAPRNKKDYDAGIKDLFKM